jgi:hypothetical protein
LLQHYVRLAVTAHPLIADYSGQVFRFPGFRNCHLVSIGFAIAHLFLASHKLRRIPVDRDAVVPGRAVAGSADTATNWPRPLPVPPLAGPGLEGEAAALWLALER